MLAMVTSSDDKKNTGDKRTNVSLRSVHALHSCTGGTRRAG